MTYLSIALALLAAAGWELAIRRGRLLQSSRSSLGAARVQLLANQFDLKVAADGLEEAFRRMNRAEDELREMKKGIAS